MSDLGCGDAEFGLELMKQGCSFYEGVEGSLNMVQKAVSVLDYTASKIQHSSMETWDFPQEQYDLVVSRLALHYLEKVDGQFVFSVQHPVLNFFSTKCNKIGTYRLEGR